ncbi:MAG: c-type cytochrome [Bradymonadia bacterium]
MRLLYAFLCLFPTLASAQSSTLSPEALAGREAMKAAQCNRCHPISDAAQKGHGLPPAEQAMHCVDCHTWILGTRGDQKAIEAQRETFPDWDRYLENIVHFTVLPDLGTLTRRVRPDFVRRYLDGPFDLRPHLDEAMIPVKLTATQKDAVVAYLTSLNPPLADPPTKPISPEGIAAGKQAFITRGCPACHVMGDTPVLPAFDAAFYGRLKAAAPADFPARLAPDLRYVRERIPRDTLVAFIQNPTQVDPKSRMPNQGVKPQEAERIADFLLAAQISPLPEAQTVSVDEGQFPVLDRPVTYDEVFDEVFGFICVHCHMHPESNNGDGGAGNTGGLGWPGARLDLETYEGMKAGLKRPGDAQATDILARGPGGEPPLLWRALLKRHQEASRDVRPPFARGPRLSTPTDGTHPGMPLGLPPLSKRKMQLIRTWLAQGAKGPTP